MADRRALLLRRAGIVALAIAVVLSVAGTFQHDLWTADEPREAEIGREMLVSGFSALPTLGGEPFMEKPPLFAWMVAASYRVFGISSGAARVPALLFGLGTLGIVYLLGRRAAGRLAGLCSVIVLGTLVQFTQTTHKAILDTGLLFFVAAGHLAFLRLRDRGSALDYVVIAVCSGLAFLTKSWIGPGLLCAPPLLAALVLRDWPYIQRVLPRAFVASVVGVGALGLPWIFAVARAPGGGWPRVEECLFTESIGRAVGGTDEFTKGGHSHGPLYYLSAAPLAVLPWTLALPAMFRGGILSRSWRGGRAAWLALVFAVGVVLLSVPAGKRDLYLVPLMPALAAAIGVWLSRVGSRRGGRWDHASLLTMGVAVAAVGLVLVYVGVGGPLPTDLRDKTAPAVALLGRSRLIVLAVAGAGIAGLAGRAIALRRASGPRFAIAVTTAVLGLFLGYLAVVRQAIDPFKELRTGALAVAALVPAEEPLLGLSCDETTIAVLPFYTGRLLTNVEEADRALAALDRGPSRHLIVLSKDLKKKGRSQLAPHLRSRLRLVGTAMMALDREVAVFEYVKP